MGLGQNEKHSATYYFNNYGKTKPAAASTEDDRVPLNSQ